MAESGEPILQVIENLAPAELYAQACTVCESRGWRFGHLSAGHDETPFWIMDLDGDAVFDAIWQSVRDRCEALAGGPLRVLRQYANGHTFGLGGKPHTDDTREGSFTLLYYPMRDWREDWEGETVFYDAHGEVDLALRPRPNRAVFFDSRIVHAGRAPGRACPMLRVTVAYKLELAPPADAEPAPAAPDWSIEEAGREGTQRVWRVRLAESLVEQWIAERLDELANTLRLPGFRPGMIPPTVMRERYGAKVRAEVLSRASGQAATHVVARGGLASAIEMVAGGASGDVEFLLTATHLPDLPEPAPMQLERLTAPDPNLAPALDAHLRQQVMDQLDASYDFPLAAPVVEREFQTIRAMAEQQGTLNEEVIAELKMIAERRVRLGAVVAELARRWEIRVSERDAEAACARGELPANARARLLEERVVARLLAGAKIVERPATQEEISELIE